MKWANPLASIQLVTTTHATAWKQQVMQLCKAIAHGNDTVSSSRLMTGGSQPLVAMSCPQQTAAVH